MLPKLDFIFLISLLIIDETDNTDYFLYKFNISKKDQKRVKNIQEFYKNKIFTKAFDEKNLNKILYYKGKEAVIDILNFRIFKSNKYENNLIDLIDIYKNKSAPMMPVKAEIIMKKFKMSEGKVLGDKLKIIEDEWVRNNFQISDKQVENIINS